MKKIENMHKTIQEISSFLFVPPMTNSVDLTLQINSPSVDKEG